MALEASPPEDRRRAPRVQARLAVSSSSSDKGESYAMQTLNISVSGAYCNVDRFIPLMTRLRLSIEIPADEDALTDTGYRYPPVDAEGIVVRSEPEEEGSEHKGYRLALFFTEIHGEGRSVLEEFVNRSREKGREI